MLRTSAPSVARPMAAPLPALAQDSTRAVDIEVVRDCYEAYATDDPEAVRPLLAPNVV